MRITIVGAGPVGLLTACLLASTHTITVLEKRREYTRHHLLNLDSETVEPICEHLSRSISPALIRLSERLRSWSEEPTSTSSIQLELLTTAEELGVTIQTEVDIMSLDSIVDSIIIGADGAKSTIRRLAFGDRLVDSHTISYMAQLKFRTSGRTKPRSALVGMGHSFLNGITGDDMVLTFETMAPPNDEFRKSGTLHVPIPESVYRILSDNGRGNVDRPWSLEELSAIIHPQVAKLVRIINRYSLGVTLRGGWIEDPMVTVLPLTIYRSEKVFTITQDKLYLLCGDSSSGLVYQRGLNKGFLESLKCAELLLDSNIHTFHLRLVNYGLYCQSLYERERDDAIAKGRKIQSTNSTISTTSKLSSLGLLAGIISSVV